MVKLYTRQSLHTTTHLLQGSRELEPKFGQIINKTKSTYYNTATPRLQGTRAKIRSNYTQDKVYTLQHSYSKAPVEVQPKFGLIIHKTKSTCYNTATPRLQGTRAKIWSNYTQDKVYTLQHSYSKAPVELQPKFGLIIHKTKPTHYNTATPRLQGTRAKIWSNYTQDKVYILQHSYSKAAVELEPKFGLIIHKTKPTHYNTATPRLQGTRAKIWSNYTQDKVYILQHSYSKAPGN